MHSLFASLRLSPTSHCRDFCKTNAGHDNSAVAKVSWIIPLLLRNCHKTRDQELHPSPTVIPEENTRVLQEGWETSRHTSRRGSSWDRKPAPNLLSIAYAEIYNIMISLSNPTPFVIMRFEKSSELIWIKIHKEAKLDEKKNKNFKKPSNKYPALCSHFLSTCFKFISLLI